MVLITYFFHESEQTYGYRRIHADLVDRGVCVSPDLVRKLMQQAGLVVCQPRKRVRTTIPAKDLVQRPDLVKRDVTANKPAQKWVGDITYISTWEGFAYLSGRDGAATRRKSLGTRLLSICALNLLLML